MLLQLAQYRAALVAVRCIADEVPVIPESVRGLSDALYQVLAGAPATKLTLSGSGFANGAIASFGEVLRREERSDHSEALRAIVGVVLDLLPEGRELVGGRLRPAVHIDQQRAQHAGVGLATQIGEHRLALRRHVAREEDVEDRPDVAPERLAGVRVAVPAREIAAGDRQPHPVPGCEAVRDGAQRDDELRDRARLQQVARQAAELLGVSRSRAGVLLQQERVALNGQRGEQP